MAFSSLIKGVGFRIYCRLIDYKKGRVQKVSIVFFGNVWFLPMEGSEGFCGYQTSLKTSKLIFRDHCPSGCLFDMLLIFLKCYTSGSSVSSPLLHYF